MDIIQLKTIETTQHIANKILQLRRISKSTQEEFAERVNLDRRTIARAEDGKHRPSAETMEMIALAFNLPVSYFFDNSIYYCSISKTALIHQINTKLNILPKSKLRAILSIIDIIKI